MGMCMKWIHNINRIMSAGAKLNNVQYLMETVYGGDLMGSDYLSNMLFLSLLLKYSRVF